MSTNIFILSAPVQTGKTTSLIKWAEGKSDVAGIVQPIVDRKRHLLDLSTNEIRLLEVFENTDNTIIVGKYSFSKPTFEWAKICLLHGMKKEMSWLVIDELGKLELDDKGLEPVVNYIVGLYKREKSRNLIMVVRDYLLNDVISKYQLSLTETKIIKSINEL